MEWGFSFAKGFWVSALLVVLEELFDPARD